MYNQHKNFDEIYDFYALRVIVDTELECYTALGLIHEMFKSIPGRFKDYISTPKPNLYRSLHTTVIGSSGIPFEVQIRTKQMHEEAQYGIAAHWKYKSGSNANSSIDEKLRWIAQLLESDESTRDPDEFLRALKVDIFHDEVFVFTPKGDVIALPQGATVIDFAYAIHSGVGNSMMGAKINGMIVPIDRVPQNGEIVEIITSSASKGPSRDWLKIVKTSEARTKIRAWFKKEKRADNIIMGRAVLEAEFKHFGRSYTEAQFVEVCTAVGARTGFMNLEDLYNTLGYGGLAISKIALKLRDEFDRAIIVSVNKYTDEFFLSIFVDGKVVYRNEYEGYEKILEILTDTYMFLPDEGTQEYDDLLTESLNEWQLMNPPASSSAPSSTGSFESYKERFKKLFNYATKHRHFSVDQTAIEELSENAHTSMFHFTHHVLGGAQGFDYDLEIILAINKPQGNWYLLVYEFDGKTHDKIADLRGPDYETLLKTLSDYIEVPAVGSAEYKDLLQESINTSIADDFKLYENLWENI